MADTSPRTGSSSSGWPRWVRSFRSIASWPGIAGTRRTPPATARGTSAAPARSGRPCTTPTTAPRALERAFGESGAHDQARTARRKLAEARALVARGKVLPGMSRAADGVAHALLRHPPRIWITQGAKVRQRESRSAALSRSAD